MGLYDRDYVQDKTYNPSSFSSTTMVVKVIIVTVAIYLLDNFSGHWFNDNLRLMTPGFRPWQLLSYGFLHAPMEQTLLHIVFNMYGLWLFGSAIESKYGGKEFLAIYLAIIVLAGALWTGMQLATGRGAVLGASGGVAGIAILFALNFPNRKMRLFPIPIVIPAWLLGVFMVLGDAMGAVARATGSLEPGQAGSNVAFIVHLAGAALAAAYFYSGIRLTSPGGSGFSFKMPNLSRPKLKVHDPDRRYADLDRQADRLLDKVHREGQDSLTAAERKILDDYSRRMRQRRS